MIEELYVYLTDLNFTGSIGEYNEARAKAWRDLGVEGKRPFKLQADRINGTGELLTEEDREIKWEFFQDLLIYCVSSNICYGPTQDHYADNMDLLDPGGTEYL